MHSFAMYLEHHYIQTSRTTVETMPRELGFMFGLMMSIIVLFVLDVLHSGWVDSMRCTLFYYRVDIIEVCFLLVFFVHCVLLFWQVFFAR